MKTTLRSRCVFIALLAVTSTLLILYSVIIYNPEYSPLATIHSYTNISFFRESYHGNQSNYSNTSWLPESISPLLSNLTSPWFVQQKEYLVVFVIPSLDTHAPQRAAIRETWANFSRWSAVSGVRDPRWSAVSGVRDPRFKVMFILGTRRSDSGPSVALQSEIDEYEDMYYAGELVEHRTILKYKVIWGMKMAVSLFSFSYLVKTDDDVAVNLPRMLEDLSTEPRDHYYSGSCRMGYGGFAGFPRWRYCSGGGYVLSRDVVEKFNKLPEEVYKVPFKPEDGFTGWLVYNVNKILGYHVVPVSKGRLSVRGYTCGVRGAWFYHQCKTPERHRETFEIMNAEHDVIC